MPRRTHPRQRRTPRIDHDWTDSEPTFEEIARDLVNRGICSSKILDRPQWKKDTT